MRRVGVTELRLTDGPIVLDEASARYVGFILRMRAGDLIEAFDDAGVCIQGVLRFVGGAPQIDDWVRIEATRAEADPAEAALADSAPGTANDERELGHLVLAAALTKASRWEWTLEKAAELGATHIVPIQAQRSVVVVPAAKVAKRVERWQRIVREASRQCGRRDSPKVEAPQSLQEALEHPVGSVAVWWCAEVPTERWAAGDLASADLRSCGVLIGPEGGWTESERALLMERAQCLALGPRVLRAESACVAALVRVQCVREGW